MVDHVKTASWLASALLSIGVGILTSVTIVYAYDNLLANRNEQERTERERHAISAIGPTIRQHYRVLLDCYRSSYNFAAVPSFRDVNEFLGPQYQPVFSHLDIYSSSPSNSVGSIPYYQYIESSFTSLNQAIHSMLTVSGRDIGQEVLLAANRVRSSEFMVITQSLTALCTTSIPGFGRVPSQLITEMKEPINAYCAALAKFISALEKSHPQGLREYSQTDWHNEIIAPGHARRV